MGTTSGLRGDRDVTSELIERIASGELGAKLRSQVASRYPGAGRDEVEEAFQQACLAAERSCPGETEGEVFTWLRTTTRRELGHMRRRSRSRSRRELLVDVTAPEFQVADAAAVGPEDALIEREDQAEVERVARAVLVRLSERQRQIVVLHSHGCRRSEIAEQLGMTPRSVKRALERILAVGREELVRLAGRGCESGEPVVARLAFGLASPREARQAQLHLTTCARCGAVYERLDLWREKVAALLPIPAAEQAHPGIVERVLHGTADAVSNLRQHAGESASAGRDHLADATGQVKQHATTTYSRVMDPTPLAGVRPGAVAAAVAGCLAVAGSATYCVEQGVDPVGALDGMVTSVGEQKAKTPRKPAHARHAQATPTATAPSPTTTPTPEPPTPEPTPQAAPASTPAPTPAATAPPTPQEEYEPVAPATAATASPASSAPSRTPAPAPANGPGEFDGP